jgi:hypothetical protein
VSVGGRAKRTPGVGGGARVRERPSPGARLPAGIALALLACLLSSCAVAPAPRAAGPRVVAPSGIAWPRREVLDLAAQAYACGNREGYFRRPVLTIIDYSLPSTEPRLWVIDLRRKRILHRELVAHGRNSGDLFAVAFSNRIGSRQSSLGLFRTDEAYVGRHGQALRLSGLEPGFNDNARERAIVLHGAPYVSATHIAAWGSLGRSWGCPALPEGVSGRVIDRIAGGSAVFAYYPDDEWMRSSHFLHCGEPLASAFDVDRR